MENAARAHNGPRRDTVAVSPILYYDVRIKKISHCLVYFCQLLGCNDKLVVVTVAEAPFPLCDDVFRRALGSNLRRRSSTQRSCRQEVGS